MRSALPQFFKSISSRLLILTLVWVSFIVTSIGYTMFLNWQLEASASAKFLIADVRGYMMRALYLSQPDANRQAFQNEVIHINDTFELLRKGDPWVPVRVPDTQTIQTEFQKLQKGWTDIVRPMLERDSHTNAAQREQDAQVVSQYVDSITELTQQIEDYRATFLWQLRYLQLLLIVLAIGSLFAIMWLLVRWVIRPLDQLGEGINRLSSGNLGARVYIQNTDEFGDIALGFNRMADRLEDLYNNLEQKVAEKTASVEEKNRHLAQLYEITSFFSRQLPLEEITDGFVERIERYTEADGCLVALLDSHKTHHATISASVGLPAQFLKALTVDNLSGELCEVVLSKSYPISIHDTQQEYRTAQVLRETGYKVAYCFQVRSTSDDMGIFMIVFKEDPGLSSQIVQLLESFSTHLGVAIDNRRLIERERQYAIVQERQLLAQGLHDSIAQALSFLNLQVQFLTDAIDQKDDEQRDQALGQIRTGVKECYEDVRELLLNFRERLHKEDFVQGVNTVIDRFEGQSHVSARLRVVGKGGELTERQKLQVIFIIQEALSNVRKHAQASHVDIRIENNEDLVVSITDDGVGIDQKLVDQRKGQHVGLSIMTERASRIGAKVQVERASPAGGTRVTLVLPNEARRQG